MLKTKQGRGTSVCPEAWQGLGSPASPLGAIAGRMVEVAAVQRKIEAHAAAMASVLPADSPVLKLARKVLGKFEIRVSSPSEAELDEYHAAFNGLSSDVRQAIHARRRLLCQVEETQDGLSAEQWAKVHRVLRLQPLVSQHLGEDSAIGIAFELAVGAIDAEYPPRAMHLPLIEHALAVWGELSAEERMRVLNGWSDNVGATSILKLASDVRRLECCNVVTARVAAGDRPEVVVRKDVVIVNPDAPYSPVQVFVEEGTPAAEAIETLRGMVDAIAATINEAVQMTEFGYIKAPLLKVRNEAVLHTFNPGEPAKTKPLAVSPASNTVSAGAQARAAAA